MQRAREAVSGREGGAGKQGGQLWPGASLRTDGCEVDVRRMVVPEEVEPRAARVVPRVLRAARLAGRGAVETLRRCKGGREAEDTPGVSSKQGGCPTEEVASGTAQPPPPGRRRRMLHSGREERHSKSSSRGR